MLRIRRPEYLFRRRSTVWKAIFAIGGILKKAALTRIWLAELCSTLSFLLLQWYICRHDGWLSPTMSTKPVQEFTFITVVLNLSYSTGNVRVLGEFEESRYWDDLHCRVVLTTTLSASTMIYWSKWRVNVNSAINKSWYIKLPVFVSCWTKNVCVLGNFEESSQLHDLYCRVSDGQSMGHRRSIEVVDCAWKKKP